MDDKRQKLALTGSKAKILLSVCTAGGIIFGFALNYLINSLKKGGLTMEIYLVLFWVFGPATWFVLVRRFLAKDQERPGYLQNFGDVFMFNMLSFFIACLTFFSIFACKCLWPVKP